MVAELQLLFDFLGPESVRNMYFAAITDENILGKTTSSSRALTRQRLVELYALDPKIAVFRIFRKLWEVDKPGRPLLAVLCALARDPLLRAGAPPVLDTRPGEDLSRQALKDALRDAVGNRLNEASLDKVARNTASSWTQSGHLRGRSRKIRQRVVATPAVTAFALVLGYLQGLRGRRLFQTDWTRVLDTTFDGLLELAGDAKRFGLLDLKRAGDVIEITFPTLLTEQERHLVHGAH